MHKQWSIQAGVEGVAAARRRAAEIFSEAELGQDERQVLVLLVSELVTNAVVHGRPPVTMSVDVDRGRTRIEVTDAVDSVPHMRTADRGADGGRGLALVERLATRWGTSIGDDGKVVWLELERLRRRASTPVTAA